MSRRACTDWLAYVAVRVLVCVIQSISIETCQAASRWLAWLAHDVICMRAKVVDENLTHAFPHLAPRARRRLARQMWEHLFLMVAEIAHAPRKIHRCNWHRYFTVPAKNQIVAALLDRRPTLLISGHHGNFELGGFVAGLLGFPTYTIARTLDNPLIDRYLNQFRGFNGQFILPKQGSAAQVEDALAAGKALTLLGDQYAGPKGCWVEMFGRPTSCHKAIALFTLTAGANMLILYTVRSGRPLRFTVGLAGRAEAAALPAELAGVKPLTQWYSRCLEAAIRRAPGQYWWLHRRWKGEPPRRVARPTQHAA